MKHLTALISLFRQEPHDPAEELAEYIRKSNNVRMYASSRLMKAYVTGSISKKTYHEGLVYFEKRRWKK